MMDIAIVSPWVPAIVQIQKKTLNPLLINQPFPWIAKNSKVKLNQNIYRGWIFQKHNQTI